MNKCKCENCDCEVKKDNDRVIIIKAFLLIIGLGVFFGILWELLTPYLS